MTGSETGANVHDVIIVINETELHIDARVANLAHVHCILYESDANGYSYLSWFCARLVDRYLLLTYPKYRLSTILSHHDGH